jgi:uncharacterized protein (DUF58 family)
MGLLQQPASPHYWLPRTIWPTREGWWFLGATLAIGLAATNTGNNLLYLILAMMLSLLAVSGLLSEQTMRRVRARRELPRRLFAGSPAAVGVSLTNGKRRLPSYALHLTEPDPASDERRDRFFLRIDAGARAVWQYGMTFPSRGVHRFPGLRLFTRFPFGLFAKTSRPLLADPVLVYPAVRSLAPHEVPAALEPGWRERPRPGHGAGLYNLRPYRPGDDPRQIHWKTSARTGDLMLKETEEEDQPRVRIVIEDPAPEAPPAAVEADLGYAASLAVHAIRRGILVQLVSPEGATEFGLGEPHLDRLLEHLALYRRPAVPRPAPCPGEESRVVAVRLGTHAGRPPGGA